MNELRRQIREHYYNLYPDDDEAKLNNYIEKITKYVEELNLCNSVREEVRIIESVYEQHGVGEDYLDIQPIIYSNRKIAYIPIDNDDAIKRIIAFFELYNVPRREYCFYRGEFYFRFSQTMNSSASDNNLDGAIG